MLGLIAALLVGPEVRAAHGEPIQDVERLEEWPELPRGESRRVDHDVQRLRKARTQAMGELARTALIADGAAAAPRLIAALGKEQNPAAQARITGVLDRITTRQRSDPAPAP